MYIEDLFPDLELESKTVEYKGIIEEGKKYISDGEKVKVR